MHCCFSELCARLVLSLKYFICLMLMITNALTFVFNVSTDGNERRDGWSYLKDQGFVSWTFTGELNFLSCFIIFWGRRDLFSKNHCLLLSRDYWKEWVIPSQRIFTSSTLSKRTFHTLFSGLLFLRRSSFRFLLTILLHLLYWCNSC